MLELISVLIVGENPYFLAIVTRCLQECHCGELAIRSAIGETEAIAQIERLRPQVILLDAQMPDLDELKIIPCLRATLPYVHIIVLMLLDTEPYLSTAMRAGADEVVPKSRLRANLLPAIRRAVQVSGS